MILNGFKLLLTCQLKKCSVRLPTPFVCLKLFVSKQTTPLRKHEKVRKWKQLPNGCCFCVRSIGEAVQNCDHGKQVMGQTTSQTIPRQPLSTASALNKRGAFTFSYQVQKGCVCQIQRSVHIPQISVRAWR